MISHKYKLIFIHIPKCAGTSVENWFLEDAGLDMNNRQGLAIGQSLNSDGPRRLSHYSLSEYLNFGYLNIEMLSEYKIFTILRDPLDRLYSTYRYRGYDARMSFDTFVKKRLPRLIDSDENFFYRPQIEFFDNNYNVNMFHINSIKDCEYFLSKITGKDVVLKKINVSDNKKSTTIRKSLQRLISNDKELSNQSLETIKHYYSADFDFIEEKF